MSVTNVTRHSWLWMATLLVVLAIPAVSEVDITGYVQARYTNVEGATPPGTFETPRARIVLTTDIDEQVSARVQYDVATSEIKQAYGQYALNDEIALRLGLDNVPFGYELPLSSSERITLEPSQAVSVLMGASEYERGFYANYASESNPLTISAGLVNGNGSAIPTDNNNHKSLVGRVGYDFSGAKVGVSKGVGCVGIDARYQIDDISLVAEAVRGTSSGTKPSGGYLTLAYQQEDSLLQPYLRLDTFDPVGADNNYNRITLGLNYYVAENAKVTLELQSIDDDADADHDNEIGVQYQVHF